jgi:hypothetical protein
MSGEFTTGPAAGSLTREALRRLPSRPLHTGRNVSKALVSVFEIDGARVVVKDFAPRPWPVRLLLGPWQLRREARAYARLRGLAGIPRLLGVLDAQALALEFVDARPLRGMRRGAIDASFFERLEALVRAVHQHGVAHGDLHHGDVLAGAQGQPYVVDFATSIVVEPGTRGLRRSLFEQMRDADLRAVAKLRRRLLGGEGGPEPPPRRGLYRMGAALRGLFRPGAR